jgi:hypothetical protein
MVTLERVVESCEKKQLHRNAGPKSRRISSENPAAEKVGVSGKDAIRFIARTSISCPLCAEQRNLYAKCGANSFESQLVSEASILGAKHGPSRLHIDRSHPEEESCGKDEK